MKIEKIHIENFRSIKDQTIFLDDYTSFVGPNGSGKSNVLAALNVFFRNAKDVSTEVTTLSEEDFHHRDTSKPIRIEVTFTELSPEAQEDFKAYCRQGRLVIFSNAEWDPQAKSAEVKQYGARLVMKEFATKYFEAKDSPAAALKTIYAELQKRFPDLPTAKSKDAMETALREYEEQHPDKCTLQDSSDLFYGYTKGTNLLAKYVQWTYVPAVKDATTEQTEARDTALGQLLSMAIRSKVDFSGPIADLQAKVEAEYATILSQQETALSDISTKLTVGLQQWSHPDTQIKLHWYQDPRRAVVLQEPSARAKMGEGGFLGELTRLGHGLQRSFIVVLLQELARADDTKSPTLILSMEEPELYQHPPQARHLAAVLCELAGQRAQVLITTHSPYFVSAEEFEHVRRVTAIGPTRETRITQFAAKDLAKMLAEALCKSPSPTSSVMAAVGQILQPSQSELFFCQLPIFVEGIEDAVFIATSFHLLNLGSEFRRLGCHFVVCNGKTSMSRLVAIAKGFNMSHFVVFDSDAEKVRKDDLKEKPKGIRAEQQRDNVCLLKLGGRDAQDPLPTEHLWSDNLVMWADEIAVAVKDDIKHDVWQVAEDTVRTEQELHDGVGKKNVMLVAATLEKLFSQGQQSALLKKLCEAILKHAQTKNA